VSGLCDSLVEEQRSSTCDREPHVGSRPLDQDLARVMPGARRVRRIFATVA
jgi:hypothetical protein